MSGEYCCKLLTIKCERTVGDTVNRVFGGRKIRESICHRGWIERHSGPESFQRRLGELLLLEKNANNLRSDHQSLAGKAPVAPAGGDAVGGHPQQRQRDKLAF